MDTCWLGPCVANTPCLTVNVEIDVNSFFSFLSQSIYNIIVFLSKSKTNCFFQKRTIRYTVGGVREGKIETRLTDEWSRSKRRNYVVKNADTTSVARRAEDMPRSASHEHCAGKLTSSDVRRQLYFRVCLPTTTTTTATARMYIITKIL